mmetsp:Transcript_17892/g.43791  ORF Transcript_17892/g.43791 Transcript_17892/m.43791 type:complete len:514 (-) Transcript_17892:86-1627(-)|eukprot:CAMPEP_0114517624 /NCGR_PEP_ID=MMETSP0109-20121206/17995_1 /TAXON_ID=29199 /ORGANISM="Chlorarachnion reptans, Strain CCCM449" /LENGTH=513 /DNA_ID=CAMNT_0001698161 /DNA_START=137 /DNA_END=1678 /DNA_ORIENTATION=-
MAQSGGEKKDANRKETKVRDARGIDQLALEDVRRLKNEIQRIESSKSIDFINNETLRKKGKETIQFMMANCSRTDKFQPNKYQIKIMRENAPSLAKWLRGSTFRQFHDFLFPAEVNDPESRYILAKTIFQHSGVIANRTDEDDQVELLDQLRRAKAIATEIREKINQKKTHLYLLDGHGRMLLCILHQLIALEATEEGKTLGLYQENLIIHVVDLDEDVDTFHKIVFPECVQCHHSNIITGDANSDCYPKEESVVYLNFCSVPSAGKAYHAPKPKSGWYFCKETVLRYIHAIAYSRRCEVFVSLFVQGDDDKRDFIDLTTKQKEENSTGPSTTTTNKDSKDSSTTTDRYLTGQGFCNFLLRRFPHIKLTSIRPEDGFTWKKGTEKIELRKTQDETIDSLNTEIQERTGTVIVEADKSYPSGSFVSFHISGKNVRENDEKSIGDLKNEFSNMQFAKMQPGDMVKEVASTPKGKKCKVAPEDKNGKVISRSPKKITFRCGDTDTTMNIRRLQLEE